MQGGRARRACKASVQGSRAGGARGSAWVERGEPRRAVAQGVRVGSAWDGAGGGLNGMKVVTTAREANMALRFGCGGSALGHSGGGTGNSGSSSGNGDDDGRGRGTGDDGGWSPSSIFLE